MKRFGEDQDTEMRQARERAAELQKRHDREGDAAYARKYPRPRRADRSGTWRFTELLNTSGELTGYRVDLDGRIAAMIVLHGPDLQVIATGDEDDQNAPDALQVMTAFEARNR